MKALTIRQPWCWFIFADFLWAKRFENRDWIPTYLAAQLTLCPPGSNVLIHAAKGCTKAEFKSACDFALQAGATQLPDFDQLQRGGIVGMVKFVRVVTASADPWFTGPLALELADAYPLHFQPCTGALAFWDYTGPQHPIVGDEVTSL